MKNLDIVAFIKNNKSYFEDYITRSTYNSNAIEGSTLSYADTYAIVFKDDSFKVSAKPREIYEAINHKYALNFVIDNLQNEADERFIIEIAKIINKNINDISGFRNVDVFIRGAEHIPPKKEVVQNKMLYFIDNYNNAKHTSIFEKIAYNHIEFEKIHPFADGNGRTGRLIINYELLKHNIAPSIIPVEDRSKYFEFLKTSNVENFSIYLEDLSKQEAERLKKFLL
ncbi:Fic family protein [Endomicrobium proavitum]|uniref:Fic family protein n=1 Tax=Endomicrobium proavitum TaxID=1408281 RepID=A0A0G3WK63_9BACT|nr:Fic family protein [Endomicrobium proavitum]AKL97889.1 Fic family protein [Endomicrobium proavitum]